MKTSSLIVPLLVSAALLSSAAAAQNSRPSAQPQSNAAVPANPLRFSAEMEKPEPDEAQTAAAINDAMREVQQITFANYKHAVRSVHAKAHGYLRGELRVLDNLPGPLAQGVFAKPGTHQVLMRLSTSPGDVLPDSVSTPRGVALKVFAVEGERLPGAQGQTQDFLMVNGPAFIASDAKSFLMTLQLLAKTTDRFEVFKKALSVAARATDKALSTVGIESPTLRGSGGQPETHILGETFYTQVPMLYGAYVAKVALTPVSPELTALANAPLDLDGNPNALRQAVLDFFRSKGGEWEVRVQLATNLDDMPIEDAAKEWPEDKSAYVPVARIKVDPQVAWSEELAAAIDDGFKFSPWNGLAAHRPLGSIMRVRKISYERSAQFRAQNNKRAVEEPADLSNLPR